MLYISRNMLRQLFITLAVGLITLTLAALACGPSAQTGQENATPEPTTTATSAATPTPSIDCNSPEHERNPACWDPPPTPSDFRKKYDKFGMAGEMENYEKAQEQAGASGPVSYIS